MYVDPQPQIEEIELQPVHAKGELVVDNWWQPPELETETFLRRNWLRIITLAIPIAAAAVYLVFIASNQFVSEARFMVRGPSASGGFSLASLINDQKVTRASDETYAVSEYLVSRDAMETLLRNNGLANLFARDEADMFSRFPNFYSRRTGEARYQHFKNFVDVTLDYESGIATLRARAFTPDDAIAFNKALLANAQVFVNKLNDGIFRDTLQLASRHVDEARAKFSEIEARLTAYRNRESIVDPTKESTDQLSRIGAMMTKLSQAESELSKQTMLAPRSPQVAALSSDIEAIREQIAKQRSEMSGSQSSMANKFSEFDEIMLDRLLASKTLETALDQMQRAQRDLEQQQYYLQTVVEPNLPDQATYPRRLLDILIVAGVCFCIYATLNTLLTTVREHQH